MDPKVEGYWEVTGAKLTFIHKDPFVVGATYSVAVPDTVRVTGITTGLFEADEVIVIVPL